MPMTGFFIHFPDIAFKETRVVTTRGRPDLPDGEYGFLELYCDEVDCDCRRVMINVVSKDAGPQHLATINYGWEPLEFYEKWARNKEIAVDMAGAELDMLNHQTEYAPALLRLFEFLLQDEAYVERLKRHYWMFKAKLQKDARTKRARRKRARKS